MYYSRITDAAVKALRSSRIHNLLWHFPAYKPKTKAAKREKVGLIYSLPLYKLGIVRIKRIDMPPVRTIARSLALILPEFTFTSLISLKYFC